MKYISAAVTSLILTTLSTMGTARQLVFNMWPNVSTDFCDVKVLANCQQR